MPSLHDQLVRAKPDLGHRPDVLRAIARQITIAQAQIRQAEASASQHDADPESVPQHPPTPLPGYQLSEITITVGSPAAGRTLADLTWPPGSTHVTILRGHQLRPPQPELTLAPGDPPRRDPGGGHAAPTVNRSSDHA